MTEQLPVSLGRSPLLETIFEIRFDPSIPAAGDLLPGVLFSRLQSAYPNVEPLPISSVPREIRAQDPALIFQPSHRLSDGNMVVQVGDRVLSLSAQRYPGWATFKSSIEHLLAAAKNTGFIDQVTRYSFRYINLLQKIEGLPELSLLNVDFAISGTTPLERGLQMRFEQDSDEFTTIFQIALQSVFQLPHGPQISGVLVDVDTQMLSPRSDFFAVLPELLDPCHESLKRAFFSTLSQQCLEALLPVYS